MGIEKRKIRAKRLFDEIRRMELLLKRLIAGLSNAQEARADALFEELRRTTKVSAFPELKKGVKFEDLEFEIWFHNDEADEYDRLR